jgi:hypothetical protein
VKLEEVATQLLYEAIRAGQPPRTPELTAAYVLGFEVLPEEFDLDSVGLELSGDIQGFVLDCISSAPGGVVETRETSLTRGRFNREWITLWARSPDTVRSHLLDVLASIEVQLDQFLFADSQGSEDRLSDLRADERVPLTPTEDFRFRLKLVEVRFVHPRSTFASHQDQGSVMSRQ